MYLFVYRYGRRHAKNNEYGKFENFVDVADIYTIYVQVTYSLNAAAQEI